MPPIPPAHSTRCPRMLVCDLDGTLLNSKGTMTEATMAALRQAVEAGVKIAFATGRRHSFALRALEPMGLDRDTVLISSNGAIVRTFSGDRMRCTSMPIPTATELCRQLDRFRNLLIFTFERTGPGALVVEDMEALYRRIPRWMDSNAHEIVCIAPLERAFASGEEPVQAMVCGTLQQMEVAMAALDDRRSEAVDLRRSLSIHRTEYASRDLTIVDFMPETCSKGAAIAWLAAEWGIGATDIACIGDNMNDADMLEFAGQAVLMSNAPAELLAIADGNGWTVAGSNDEEGASQAILRMLGESPQAALHTGEVAVAGD